MTEASSVAVTWDLTPLYTGMSDPQIDRDLLSIATRARQYADMVCSVQDRLGDPSVMHIVLDGLEELQRTGIYVEPRPDEQFVGSKPEYYAALNLSQTTDDPDAIALEGKVRAWAVGVRTSLGFVLRAIGRVSAEDQTVLLRDPDLAEYRLWLRRRFQNGPHDLDEAQAHVASLLLPTGTEAWARVMELSVIPTRVGRVGADAIAYADLMPLVLSSDSLRRPLAQQGLGEVLADAAIVGGPALNAYIQSRMGLAGLRGLPHALNMRCIDDDIDADTVRTLLDAMAAHFPSVHEFYRLRALVLSGGNKDTLPYADRSRPIPVAGAPARTYEWDEAVALVRSVWARVDPWFAEQLDIAIATGRVFNGSTKNARCWRSVGDLPPYLELNFRGTIKDVLTFGHEFGHYASALLTVAMQNALNDNPSIPMAEIPSVLVEQIVGEMLRPDGEQSDEARLAQLMERMDGLAGSFFRQAAGTRLETELYDAMAAEGSLPNARLSEIFVKHIRSYMGGAVTFENNAELAWVLWPHLMQGFYMFGYVVAAAVATMLRRRIHDDPTYITQIKQLIAAGNSRKLEELLREMYYLDIATPEFWEQVTEEWYGMLAELKALMGRLGYNVS